MADSEGKKNQGPLNRLLYKAESFLNYEGPKGIRPFHVALLLVLIAASVLAGALVRLESSELPFADRIASSHIDNLIVQDAAASVSERSPNLPQEYVDRQVQDVLQKAREENQYSFSSGVFRGQSIPNITAQKLAVAESIRSGFQDEQGVAYLPDIDTYYWFRYAENFVETGEIADEIRDGRRFDNHQLAPLGVEMSYPLYAYSIGLFHKIAGKPVALIMGKPESLTLSFAFFPVFLMGLVSLLVFLAVRVVAGSMAGFFSALIVGIHPNLMGRTLFGRGDTDAFVIFLAVMVTFCAVKAFASSDFRWKIFWAVLGGLSVGIYSNSWPGWWWIFLLVLGSFGLSLGLSIIYQVGVKNLSKDFKIFEVDYRKVFRDFKSSVLDAKESIAMVAAYLFSSFVFTVIISGIWRFLSVLAPFNFVNIKDPVSGTSLPNVLRTVAELSEGSLGQGIQSLGGVFVFVLAVAGLAFMLARDFLYSDRHRKSFKKNFAKNIFFVILVGFWLGIILLTVTKGVRFTILAVPAFSIGLGLAFGIFGEAVASGLKSFLNIRRSAAVPAAFVIMGMLLFFLAANDMRAESYVAAGNDIPIVNDAWTKVLTDIKQNSQEDAIITSWWDFGHHFKQIADRPVTFDGATQTEPQAHWVGRMLSTSDEAEAVGILRMMNCGARKGTDLIQEKLGDSAKAFILTKRIIVEGRAEARTILLGSGFSGQEADEVLERTHCSPPESFVIASEDMVGKAGVWGHFGAWNFTRADIAKSIQGKSLDESVGYMTSKFGIPDKEAEEIFYEVQLLIDETSLDNWISPWPGFAHTESGCLKKDGKVTCQSGIQADLEKGEAVVSAEDGSSPRSLSYLSRDGFVRKEFEGSSLPYSLLVFPEGKSSYAVLLAHPEIVDGVFTRMFFLEGHGLKCFERFASETSMLGARIHAWKADWSCGQINVISGLGSGAAAGDTVTLHYVGYFDNLSVFDSTVFGYDQKNLSPEDYDLSDASLNTPFDFALGEGRVIEGFEKGVLGMKTGEEKTIAVPPEEGYTYPTHDLYNKTLNFRVRVVKIT